jgi:hypothetical protein
MGGKPALRGWLEDRGVWHVLAVKCTELLEVQAPDGPAGARTGAEELAAAVPAEQWIACSAGHGARAVGRTTGPARSLPPRLAPAWPGGCWCAAAAVMGSWPSTPATAPATTPLIGLVRVAGARAGALGAVRRQLFGSVATDSLQHPVQEDAGLPELHLPDLGPQRIGPRCLRRLDGAKSGEALGREPKELGAAVGGIVLVGRQAVAYQEVGQALHALSGQVQAAGDLGHRRGLVLDGLED